MSAVAWQEWTIRAAFVAAGIIHLLPLAGVLGRPVLERAYGIELGSGNDLVILMQHRALLFGLLSVACWVAVFTPAWRMPAGLAALVSTVAFVVLSAAQPHGPAIAKVLWTDAALAPLLAAALLLQIRAPLSNA